MHPMPLWVPAARLLPALAIVWCVTSVQGPQARGAVVGLALVAAAGAVVLERGWMGSVARAGGAIALDAVAVTAAVLLTAEAGVPLAGPVAALPVIAVHGWRLGRRSALQLAGVAALATGGAAATGLGDRGLAAVEVAIVALAAGWTALFAAEAGQASRRADVEADQLDAARHLLVRNVSHELRTPLTVIQGLLTTLFQRWDTLSEPQRLDLIDAASVNVASLDASILHFIDAGEIERDELEVSVEEVDLAAAVEQVRHKLAVALSGYDLQTHLEVDVMESDPKVVGRILELFVENAARFSPVGSPVVVNARRHGTFVELSVMDRGRGIPPHERDRVFDPFWRADVQETGVSRGAGLGLYIAKELAERLGGEVGFHTVKGRGTKFFARLPG